MRLAEGKTYKDFYVVIEIDGVLRNIRKSSGSTKLGYTDANDILIFEKKKDATAWIEKHSYKGMTCKYEVAKITNSKETGYRWEVA